MEKMKYEVFIELPGQEYLKKIVTGMNYHDLRKNYFVQLKKDKIIPEDTSYNDIYHFIHLRDAEVAPKTNKGLEILNRIIGKGGK